MKQVIETTLPTEVVLVKDTKESKFYLALKDRRCWFLVYEAIPPHVGWIFRRLDDSTGISGWHNSVAEAIESALPVVEFVVEFDSVKELLTYVYEARG